jgi:type IV pilus assembly protein PilC
MAPVKLNRRDLTFLLRNLATLTENGLSLPKALGTLADERALEKHREILLSIRKNLEAGESFSSAMNRFPGTFDTILVNQIKVGERSGTLAESLASIADQREKSSQIKSEVIRKLAYPMILVVMGGSVITFLLLHVIPVFEKTYASAHVALPLVTQLLIYVGEFARSYGIFLPAIVVIGFVAIKQLRKNPKFAIRMDQKLLEMPVLGAWLRDIAVFQVMEVLGNLLEAGFTLPDALGEAANAVGNNAVKDAVMRLQSAVKRGERFSRELERLEGLFPPVVSQLVIVGERTGNMGRAAAHIRDYLRREIERKTNVMVGTLEPVLTIFLASAVGVILLAIYLPMFDMINVVAK